MRRLPETEDAMADLPSRAFNWRQYLQFALKIAPLLPQSEQIRDSWRLADGTAISIRAVTPDDGPLLQELVSNLSLTSRYRRFFYPLHELTPDMLARFTQADPMGSMTLLAVVRDKGREVAVGMAQCVAEPYPERGDFALAVTDAWQRAGIAARLLRNLICIARTAGIEGLEGDVLAENEPMLRLLVGMDFEFEPHPDGAYLIRARREVVSSSAWKCSPLTRLATRAASSAAFMPV
jgi:GNAT superfamily N-acetyltransferase